MKEGLAPYGPDFKKIELHHMLQTKQGPIAEVTHTFHKQNQTVIHINPSIIPSGINRSEFKQWKKQYWKIRSQDFNQGK